MLEVLTKEQTIMDYWRESSYFLYNSDTEPETKISTESWTPKIETRMTTSIGKTMEIKLNPPKIFTGNWMDLNKFIQDVTLYLTMNWKVYNNDKKKIAYFLSFMTERDAASWKEEFLACK